jgi:hypothetical protein
LAGNRVVSYRILKRRFREMAIKYREPIDFVVFTEDYF